MENPQAKIVFDSLLTNHKADHTPPFDSNDKGISLEEIKIVLESSPAGIGIIQNRVLGWTNRRFYTLIGYEAGSLQGRNTRILYKTQAEYERVGKELYDKIDKTGSTCVETRLRKKDGSFLECRIRASKLNEKDPSKGIIVVVTDISELKLLQVQLQQAQKMEAIGVLAGGISHDFNNILMGIQGHLSLLQIDVSDTRKVKTHTTQIGRLVKTAAELTSRLLGFARGGKYQIKELNTNELVALSLNIFKPTRKDIRVHEAYADDLDLVAADESQLEQVFLNLVVNASQAMPDHGEIFVSTSNIVIKKDNDYPFAVKPGRYIKISIKDTGVGMDLETQKKIFDPFFSTKEAGDQKGKGLGLSTVFGIIKNHGGFILVDSEKGKGACFDVCLPSSPRNIVETKKKETRTFDQIQTGTETVLLVDDEEEIINVGKNFLNKLGYRPLIARNGLEAIEIYKLYKDEISLVVLDLVMPKMSGKEAFLKIKDIKADAKILVSTGYTVDDQVEGFLNQGCHGFLQKPFSINDFAKAVRNILDK